MLKNIPRVLSPELLSVLARMGHGDEIVLADANFPSASTAKAGPELVRYSFEIPDCIQNLMFIRVTLYCLRTDKLSSRHSSTEKDHFF